ncbi:hypothetical protein RD792_009226 [Penstemon davidsonii]|uniref:Glycerol-3-phosphate acyltransferase, chloroplastic n=1 Tax=Penstemon davidsonii TaxID=160366 RepID=A0ABR0DBI6_9LAMI|nr:hypothetical protein RD792_009226 [Penstemon davidsonii]
MIQVGFSSISSSQVKPAGSIFCLWIEVQDVGFLVGGFAGKAPFDASAVDNMRRLTEHAGVPGHIYPLAVLCYDIMPPPPQVEKDIGEKRMISFHGVGLSVARNINYHETTATLRDPEEAKMAYTQSLYSSVCEQYNVLTSAIHGKQGLKASTPTVSLSQPWL